MYTAVGLDLDSSVMWSDEGDTAYTRQLDTTWTGSVMWSDEGDTAYTRQQDTTWTAADVVRRG